MTTEDLEELKASQAGAYITKSSTLEKREGNPLPRYVDLELGSINSMGLPNLGFDYYLDYVLKNQKRKGSRSANLLFHCWYERSRKYRYA